MRNAEIFSTETPPNAESEDEVTTAHLTKLFFQSFRFSQGDEKLQRDLFTYLHSIRPGWLVTDEQYTEVAEAFRKIALSYMPVFGNLEYARKMQVNEELPDSGRHRVAHTGELDQTIETEIEELKEVLSLTPLDDKKRNKLVEDITMEIVKRDHKWLVEKGGRPRHKSESSRDATVNDPYLSHLCHYALLGNRTGQPEYDQLFSDIRSLLSGDGKEFSDKAWLKQLIVAVVDKFNEKHPNTQVGLPWLKGV